MGINMKGFVGQKSQKLSSKLLYCTWFPKRGGEAAATPRNVRVLFRAVQRLNCPQAGEEVPKQQESEPT